jgi:hypothetical protein
MVCGLVAAKVKLADAVRRVKTDESTPITNMRTARRYLIDFIQQNGWQGERNSCEKFPVSRNGVTTFIEAGVEFDRDLCSVTLRIVFEDEDNLNVDTGLRDSSKTFLHTVQSRTQLRV